MDEGVSNGNQEGIIKPTYILFLEQTLKIEFSILGVRLYIAQYTRGFSDEDLS